MNKFEISSDQPFIQQFNGQTCVLHKHSDTHEPTIGAGGQTKLYNLTSGGGLFLRDDEVKLRS